jgi:hypothetical protein
MSQPSDLTTELPPAPARAGAWRAVQVAPGPETPDTPDRGGRQAGMAILIGAGVAFWSGVGALTWYLLNR